MIFNLLRISLIRCAYGYNPSTSSNLYVNSDLSYNYDPNLNINYTNDLFNNIDKNQGYQGTYKLIKLPFNIKKIIETGTFHTKLDDIDAQVADFLVNINQITEIFKSGNKMIGVQDSNELITLKDLLTHFKNLQQVIETQARNANLCYNGLQKIDFIRKNLNQIVSILKEIKKSKKQK